MKKQNYLVTGGFGFIGSHLTEELLNQGNNVTVLDNLSNGELSNLPNQNFTKIIYDVENIRFLKNTDKFDGIFHLATAPRSSSLDNPFRDIETNCKGMINMLELARSMGSKVVFTSNSGIYGSMVGDKLIDENSPNNPTTPYDANKLVSEYYAKIYHDIHKVDSAIVRFATVFGERQKVNESLNWRPLVATFVKNLVNNEDVIINGDGYQTRDLIYVKDVVRALILLMNSKINDASIYLISTGIETSVNQVLDYVEETMCKKANVKHTEALKGDIRRMCYNNQKAKSAFGFQPRFTVRDGIESMVRSEAKKKK